MMRFQPYEIPRARANEYKNAEAGSSTLAPPLVPYVGLSMPQPSGGISKTPANAGQYNKDTEEDKVPVSNFYCSRVPHMTESLSGVRPLSGLGALARTVCGNR